MITIRIEGLEELHKMLVNLPKNLNKNIMKGSEKFMFNVLKGARARAPVASGFLKNQISIKKAGNEIILDTGDAYYAYYQEYGFKPHKIPVQYMEMHYGSPGTPGQKIPKNEVSGFVFVSKSKPFLMPALLSELDNLGNILSSSVKTAVEES